MATKEEEGVKRSSWIYLYRPVLIATHRKASHTVCRSRLETERLISLQRHAFNHFLSPQEFSFKQAALIWPADLSSAPSFHAPTHDFTPNGQGSKRDIYALFSSRTPSFKFPASCGSTVLGALQHRRESNQELLNANSASLLFMSDS